MQIRKLSSTILPAGLFLNLEDALTLDLTLQDKEYIPISLLEQGRPAGTFGASQEASKSQKARQTSGNGVLSSMLHRRNHITRTKVTLVTFVLRITCAADCVCPPCQPSGGQCRILLHGIQYMPCCPWERAAHSPQLLTWESLSGAL